MQTINVYAYILTTKRYGSGVGPSPTHCAECGDVLERGPMSLGCGYHDDREVTREEFAAACESWQQIATLPAADRPQTIKRMRAVCWDCCAREDRSAMIATGRATLYLVGALVTNWPGSLSFVTKARKVSRNNFGAYRTDVWFTGPDGYQWHAVNVGDNDIARCRRTKIKASQEVSK